MYNSLILNYKSFHNPLRLGLVLLVITLNGLNANIICESNGTTDYAYNLPQRNIINCPSYNKFTFSCHTYHVINIDSLKFSPYSPNPTGECTSDWAAECSDTDQALDYLRNKCSSSESCTIHSNELRKKTKCILNEVISISYKCIPTWEVIQVPIKCDVCKNVTFTSGDTPNFGFLHSNWYTHHEAQFLSCNSQIQNKPDHVVVIYSVNGYIGPDQILVETYNDYGVYISQVLSGNITTNLVLISNYNVNITIIPETYQVFHNPHFLLYYYVVPKCEYMLCPEKPVYPVITSPVTIPITTAMTTTAYVEQSTFAPPLIADKQKKGSPATVSDAWLAAILGLVYAVLMIFAVLAAVYFRRRRRNNQVTDTEVILNPSMISTSRVMTPSMLHNQSNISLSESSMKAASGFITENHHTSKSYDQTYEEYNSHIHSANQHMSHENQHNQSTLHTGEFNGFDNFSQVVNDEDHFASVMIGGGRNEMRQQSTANYESEFSQRVSANERINSEMNSTIYPYSLRGADLSTIRSSDNTLQTNSGNGYRAVEYSRSPDGERVRVTNTEEILEGGDISAQALKIDRINTSHLNIQQNATSHISAYSFQGPKKTITLNEESSKNFSVKLFPPDFNEDETQEMSMFVENSQEDLNTSRMFKIDLNR